MRSGEEDSGRGSRRGEVYSSFPAISVTADGVRESSPRDLHVRKHSPNFTPASVPPTTYIYCINVTASILKVIIIEHPFRTSGNILMNPNLTFAG